MKNLLLIVAVVVILGFVGTLGYNYFQPNSSGDSLDAVNQHVKQIQDPMANSSEVTQESQVQSRYLEYSPEVLENSKSNRRVLFFYASWCPTCRPADADFKANSDKIPSDVTVIRVNYNDPDTDQEEKALAQKYGVTYQHTYVQIDAQGNSVTKWNGGKLAELLTHIK